MPRERILIIEDEENIAELVQYTLEKGGYEVKSAPSGEEGLKSARDDLPDLVVLDLMLPGLGGLDVCKLLRDDQRTKHIPIVMLTAKSEEADIVIGLEMGADDYIPKPFSPRVLLARVRTVLRRKGEQMPGQMDTIKAHDLAILPGRHEVLVKSKKVDLTPTQFKILHLLARRPGWVFTRYQIVDGIRDDESIVTDRSVDVQIVGLRKKLGSAGKYIETVRGVGYRFKE